MEVFGNFSFSLFLTGVGDFSVYNILSIVPLLPVYPGAPTNQRRNSKKQPKRMGTYSVTCVSKIPSLRSGERSVKTKLIFECFKLNVCENYASLLIENEVRFHLFHDIFTGSTFHSIRTMST